MFLKTPLVVLLATVALVLVAAPSALASRTFVLTGEAAPRLLSIDSANPGAVASSVTLSGIPAGEVTQSIDVRPATGQLLALTVDAGAVGRLYRVEPVTGAATLLATLAADPADLTNPYTSVSGAAKIDVNP